MYKLLLSSYELPVLCSIINFCSYTLNSMNFFLNQHFWMKSGQSEFLKNLDKIWIKVVLTTKLIIAMQQWKLWQESFVTCPKMISIIANIMLLLQTLCMYVCIPAWNQFFEKFIWFKGLNFVAMSQFRLF